MLPAEGTLSRMVGSSGEANLAPVAGRVIRRKTVTLVAVATLICGLAPSVLWVRAQYGQLRSHHDVTYPLLLEWNAARLRSLLDAAVTEVGRMALAFPADRIPAPPDPAAQAELEAAPQPLEDALAPLLSRLLEPSGAYAGLLVVDPAGGVLSAVGSGPEIEALVEAIQPRTALQTQLMDAMRSVQLRKDLTSVARAELRTVSLPGLPPVLVGGAAVRGDDGVAVAFLHGVMSPDALAVELSAGPLAAADGRLSLVDAEGRTALRGPGALGGDEDASDAEGTGWLDLPSGWSLRYELPLGRFDWTLVAVQPVVPSLGAVAGTLLQAIALALVLGLGFALLAYWRTTALVQPLWSLYENMRLSVRDAKRVEMPLAGAQGEAESLIEVFNVMTRRAIQRRDEEKRSQKALRVQNEAFQAKHESLSKLTITDPLTQLANRRFLEDQISREIKRLARTQQGLSMLVVDIDDFKKLNDRYGHAAGDEFLKQVAGILREHVRATDLVARFGGEEFVVLATGTDLEGAVVLGEKLRQGVAEASFIVDESMRPRRATISVGVAQYRGSQMDLFNSADAALYEAKASGKNCVMAADLDSEPRG